MKNALSDQGKKNGVKRLGKRKLQNQVKKLIAEKIITREKTGERKMPVKAEQPKKEWENSKIDERAVKEGKIY